MASASVVVVEVAIFVGEVHDAGLEALALHHTTDAHLLVQEEPEGVRDDGFDRARPAVVSVARAAAPDPVK